MIQERPISGSFAVGDLFSFYSYGLIRPGDRNCLDAGKEINHAMAIVGLDLVGTGNSMIKKERVLMARWKDANDI